MNLETGLFFVLFLVIGFVAGMATVMGAYKTKKGGWLKLPQNTKLVLTVDRANVGHIWEPDVGPSGVARLPVAGGGLIELDRESAVWLPDQKVHLFLHYVDYFKTIPPKVSSAFTFFKGRKKEIEEAVEKGKNETLERQSDNQPETGVVFNLKDVVDWVKNITPAQLLEAANMAGVKYAGFLELFKTEQKFNWRLFLLLLIGIGIILFLFIALGGRR